MVESTLNSSGAGARASSAREATRSSSSASSRKRLMMSSPRSRWVGRGGVRQGGVEAWDQADDE
jgi:hypothetical protein